ncbi:rhomboid family intramembrane serine protease [Salinicoccus jeotgali]
MQQRREMKMPDIWRTAYEVTRYTDYTFYDFDQSREVIWLKNDKKASMMCLHATNVDTSSEDAVDYILHRLFIRGQHGVVRHVESYYPDADGASERFEADGVEITHEGIKDYGTLIDNPFYRLDLKYKQSKPAAHYQKRLLSRHPFERYMIRFTPMTYLLTAINLVVFLLNLILIHIVGSFQLTEQLAVSHSAVVSGDLYRLLSSSFLHVTVEHFLFNIFALFIAGKFIEVLYGKWRLAIAYVLTGILSSLFSLVFITEGASLGASGAVYGLIGILIVHLLIRGKIDLKLLLQVAILFVVLSFISQIMANINHYAHFGGLLLGGLLGILFNRQYFKRVWAIASISLLVLIAAVSYFMVMGSDAEPSHNQEAMSKLQAGDYGAALGIVTEAVNEGDDTAGTYHVLGLIAEYTGDYDLAEQYHEKSFEMNPKHEWAVKHKLLKLRKDKDYEAMGRILDDLNIKRIKDEELRLITKEYYGNE